MLSSRPVARNEEGPLNTMPTRTPARGLLKNHNALQENALYVGALTGNAKGKASLLQTPFRPNTLGGKAALFGSSSAMPTKPLGDKTPFPNRQLPLQTPVPQKGKYAKLGQLDPALAKTPGALLLPSARRKNLRLPRSASKKFTTPAQQGHHWDVSDGDLDPDVSVGDEEQVEEVEEEVPEIEYMPPPVPEQPYEPPFDMPNYQESGKAILTIAHSYLMDDTNDLYYAADITLQIDVNDLLEKSGGFNVESLPLPDYSNRDLDFEEVTQSRAPESAWDTESTSGPSSRRSSVSSDAPSRPLTRAASKLQATSRQLPPPTRVTRSTSRLLESSRGRTTPLNGERSSIDMRKQVAAATSRSRGQKKEKAEDDFAFLPADDLDFAFDV